MTEAAEVQEATAAAEPVMRGRFAVFATSEGRLEAIAYATPICEACQACGCGEQQEPLTMRSVFEMAMNAARSAGNGKAVKMLGVLGKVAGHG